MIYALCNSLGFVFQLLPCGLMLFLPFSKDSLRVSRKRIVIGIAAFAGILALLFPIILLLLPGLYFLGDLIMLLAALLILVSSFLLVQESPLKKLLVFFVVIFYAVSQFWMVNAAMLLIPDDFPGIDSPYGPYAPVTTVLYLLFAAISLPIMLQFVIRPLRDFLQEMGSSEINREFIIAILSTTIFVAAMMYVYNAAYNAGNYPALILLELLLLVEQFLIYWLLFRESLRRMRDEQRRRALEIQKVQYDKISREMENARRLRHDLRHHMNTLAALNAQGKRDEITAYLEKYGAEVSRLDGLKFSGDPVVDGVLEYYLTQAKDLGIPVECEVSLEKDSGVEPTDMTVLLGNCLENALEALKKLPEAQRKLSVELRTVRSMILLRIRNTANVADSGDPAGWMAFVGQERSDGHGVGLSSVSTIAKKYHGSALFQSKDGEFTTRIILNPKQA